LALSVHDRRRIQSAALRVAKDLQELEEIEMAEAHLDAMAFEEAMLVMRYGG
jgi:hypothetical protein